MIPKDFECMTIRDLKELHKKYVEEYPVEKEVQEYLERRNEGNVNNG